MKKQFYFLLLLTINTYGMDSFTTGIETLTKTIHEILFPDNENNQLLLKTYDDTIIKTPESLLQESAVLTAAHQSGLFKKHPLRLPYSSQDIQLFENINSYGTISHNNHIYATVLKLITMAYTLKTPYRYAYLLSFIMPSDPNTIIAHHILPPDKLQCLIIQHMCKKIKLDASIDLPPHSLNHPHLTAEWATNTPYTLIKITLPSSRAHETKQYHLVWNYQTHTGKLYKKHDNITLHHTQEALLIQKNNKKNKKSHLILHDLSSKKNSKLYKGDLLNTCLCSPNGKYIAALFKSNHTHCMDSAEKNDIKENNTILLWKINNTDYTPANPLIGHTQSAEAMNFSPDSTFLVSGSPETKNSVLLWNLKTQQKYTLLTDKHCHFQSFTFTKDCEQNKIIMGKTKGASLYLFTITNPNNPSCLFIPNPHGLNLEIPSPLRITHRNNKLYAHTPNSNILLHTDNFPILQVLSSPDRSKSFIASPLLKDATNETKHMYFTYLEIATPKNNPPVHDLITHLTPSQALLIEKCSHGSSTPSNKDITDIITESFNQNKAFIVTLLKKLHKDQNI